MVELQNNFNDLYHYKTYDLKRFLGPGDLQDHSDNYIKNNDYKKKKIDLFDKLDHQYNNNILFEDKDFLKTLEDYNNIDVLHRFRLAHYGHMDKRCRSVRKYNCYFFLIQKFYI
jgi:hypothetical protein